jgi:hypothetical protein
VSPFGHQAINLRGLSVRLQVESAAPTSDYSSSGVPHERHDYPAIVGAGFHRFDIGQVAGSFHFYSVNIWQAPLLDVH